MPRLLPNTFDPADPALGAIERPFDWRWESCARFLLEGQAGVLLLRLPLWWQVVSYLNDVCRTTGSTIVPSETDNMAGGAAAITSADVNAVITDTRDANAFAAFLHERGVALPPNWLIVHRADKDDWSIPAGLQHVAQEVHATPGVPVLVQCEHLAKEKLSNFHQIGDIGLPSCMKEKGTCACGQITLSRV